MISSCLNKREVIKVFSVGRRVEAEEEEKKVLLWLLLCASARMGDNLLAAVTSP